MKRRIVVCLLTIVLLTTVSSAAAQQQAKVFKIGWLGVRPDDLTAGVELLRRELRALGYVEGKNITLEYRSADNKLERLPALADELVRLKVDVLVVAASNEARVAKNATRTIPIVGANLGTDPVASGLVDSLARPGGNITGFTPIAGQLAGKRLELLKETLPKLSRVAVLWNPQSADQQTWKEHQPPARELGLQLHSMEVNSADKFESAFKEATKAGSGALVVVLSPLVNSNQQRISELAAKNRLPAIYSRADFVENGGLMSYGSGQNERFRRVAVYVDRILKGTKPADLPVEQPMKFELVINLKAAKQIGLTIPPNVLARADKVIK
jgi:putative ABC transport system substrate-binding protein